MFDMFQTPYKAGRISAGQKTFKMSIVGGVTWKAQDDEAASQVQAEEHRSQCRLRPRGESRRAQYLDLRGIWDVLRCATSLA